MQPARNTRWRHLFFSLIPTNFIFIIIYFIQTHMHSLPPTIYWILHISLLYHIYSIPFTYPLHHQRSKAYYTCFVTAPAVTLIHHAKPPRQQQQQQQQQLSFLYTRIPINKITLNQMLNKVTTIIIIKLFINLYILLFIIIKIICLRECNNYQKQS